MICSATCPVALCCMMQHLQMHTFAHSAVARRAEEQSNIAIIFHLSKHCTTMVKGTWLPMLVSTNNRNGTMHMLTAGTENCL